MKAEIHKQHSYIIFSVYILFSITAFLTINDTNLVFSTIGMASVLLIMELSRIRGFSRTLLLITTVIAVFFALFGDGYTRYFSLIILLSILPSYNIYNIRKLNYSEYVEIFRELENKQVYQAIRTL